MRRSFTDHMWRLNCIIFKTIVKYGTFFILVFLKQEVFVLFYGASDAAGLFVFFFFSSKIPNLNIEPKRMRNNHKQQDKVVISLFYFFEICILILKISLKQNIDYKIMHISKFCTKSNSQSKLRVTNVSMRIQSCSINQITDCFDNTKKLFTKIYRCTGSRFKIFVFFSLQLFRYNEHKHLHYIFDRKKKRRL